MSEKQISSEEHNKIVHALKNEIGELKNQVAGLQANQTATRDRIVRVLEEMK